MKKNYQLLNKNFLFAVFRVTLIANYWVIDYCRSTIFRATPVSAINFRAGNFRGRLPGTSALGMLLRLNEVKFSPAKNVSLIVARPRDISKFKMAAIPP